MIVQVKLICFYLTSQSACVAGLRIMIVIFPFINLSYSCIIIIMIAFHFTIVVFISSDILQ